MLNKGRAVVILGVVSLTIPTAYLVRSMFDSYQKADAAADKELILRLAESDATAMLRSGRKGLMAHCKLGQPWSYPLVDPLKNADCIKGQINQTICIGGGIPNDLINEVEDPWWDYEPTDHDPRDNTTYAVAFNNIVLNSLAERSSCFVEMSFGVAQ